MHAAMFIKDAIVGPYNRFKGIYAQSRAEGKSKSASMLSVANNIPEATTFSLSAGLVYGFLGPLNKFTPPFGSGNFSFWDAIQGGVIAYVVFKQSERICGKAENKLFTPNHPTPTPQP